MHYADTLSDRQRLICRRTAVCSTMFGCISTQLIESNALIVLYLTMLGGSDSFSMFSSSLTSLSNILLLIPCAALAAGWGLRRTYTVSSTVGFLAFGLIAAAPYFGEQAKYAVITGCFIYALTLTFYASTWYPLLDNFLKPEERGPFFSRMRFIYILFNAGLLFLLGKFLGSDPPLWLLQGVFLLAGTGLWGRKFCMDRLPLDPAMQRESPNLKKTLGICLHNQSLVGFSVYLCFMYLAFSGALPLALIYMKTCLKLADGTIVILTSIHLIGKLAGFWLAGKISKNVSMRIQVIGTHVLAGLTVLLLLIPVPGLKGSVYLFGLSFFLIGLTAALLLCISSVEMLALATPGNKIMAIAFCSTSISVGTAAGTLLTSLLLGSGALAPEWYLNGIKLTKFQLLFGLYAAAVLFFALLLPLVPAVIRKHDNYYEP
ncbi:MAG: hypothetical protein IJH79_13465 [Lentisphaeria bacterium]|nr:hypothetical protein [Lentisphaeria bacterium]